MEQKQERKPYEEPAVVYESALEVRAGTTILPILPEGVDPSGQNK